jgi:hypothetical protein
VVAGVVVVVAAALMIVVVTMTAPSGADGDTPTASGAPASSTATQTDPPEGGVTAAPVMPEATGPTGDADALPSALPAVSLDQDASTDDGISASVVSLEAVDGTGSGVGNVSGPALRVTLQLVNGSAEPVALDFVSVNLTYGADRTPASPLDDPSAAWFSGVLEPGDAAQGVYVFTVPSQDRDLVSVAVGSRAGAPYLIFEGAAP